MSTAVLVGIVGVLVLRALVYVPFVGPEIHDGRALRDSIDLCGRDWTLSDGNRYTTTDFARFESGFPVVADPRLFAPCPAGACNAVRGGPCTTVIFVRVGDDEFVAYSLAGGP